MTNHQYAEDGQIEVTIERGGERVTAFVPEDSTVNALIEQGHLRGINVAGTRVNGGPADGDTRLQHGDQVTQVPKSGEQGR